MRNEKGFTLVEVIISIAVLSILSVIFLQLFVKADVILDESRVLDAAIVEANTAIEQLKGADSIEGLKNDPLFESYEWKNHDEPYELTKTVIHNISDKDDYQLVVRLTINSDGNDYASLYDVMATIKNATLDEEVYQVKTSIILE